MLVMRKSVVGSKEKKLRLEGKEIRLTTARNASTLSLF